MTDKPVSAGEVTDAPESYEPPQIEQVLTDEALARAVHYAGGTSTDSADGGVGV
jgi:hypothetical protein